jgi:hypothetical protein
MSELNMEGNRTKNLAIVFFMISIAIGISMIPELNKHGTDALMLAAENEFMYEKAIHILAMLLMGFGFLMVFVKKYGYHYHSIY